jgi:uncharacterized protein YodC (DUF2158 family)
MATQAQPNFKAGDLVELISGGPPMTVTKVIGPLADGYHYHTSWFAAKKHETGSFPEAALKPAKGVGGGNQP